MAPQRARHRLPAGRLPVLRATALAALLTLPAAAAEDAPGVERLLERLGEETRSHDRDTRTLEDLLPLYRDVAGDPDQPDSRRDELWFRYDAALKRANKSCDAQKGLIDAVNLAALGAAIGGGPDGAAVARAAAGVRPYEVEHTRLCRLNDRFIADFASARAAGESERARRAEAASAARVRLSLGALGLAAAGAVYAALRLRR